MNTNKRTICRGGFSLTEMLIATGIMAIGLVLVALIFPVGVKLTTLTTERSIAAVVADEAFAKVQLHGLRDFADWPSAVLNPLISGDPDPDATYDYCDRFKYTTPVEVFDGADNFWDTSDDTYYTPGPDGDYESSDGTEGDDDIELDLNEDFFYPSVPSATDRKYRWTALCRRVGDKDVQVTVFVSRTTLGGIRYYTLPYDMANTAYDHQDTADHPVPVPVNVYYNVGGVASPPMRELEIDTSAGTHTDEWDNITANSFYGFFDEGYMIVNDRDGRIYRIKEMENTDGSADGSRETLILSEDFQWDGYDSDPTNPPTTQQVETVWVIPPGVGSSRYPCVGVFQKVIRLDEID